jgi:hypothetical protein
VQFIDCDLRGAWFGEALLGANRFQGCCLAGAVGLSEEQAGYIRMRGGTFSDPGDPWPAAAEAARARRAAARSQRGWKRSIGASAGIPPQ